MQLTIISMSKAGCSTKDPAIVTPDRGSKSGEVKISPIQGLLIGFADWLIGCGHKIKARYQAEPAPYDPLGSHWMGY